MQKEDNQSNQQEDVSRDDANGQYTVAHQEGAVDSSTEDEKTGQEGVEAEGVQELSEVQSLKEHVQELEDMMKRRAAELDNFRKRVQDEKGHIKELAQESILMGLLPIFDNIERALDSCKSPDVTVESIASGLGGVMSLFQDFLKSYHIEKIDSVGNDFDAKIHEALFVQDGDYETKKVIQEVEKAYTRNGRVIRTAKVGIGVPKENK